MSKNTEIKFVGPLPKPEHARRNWNTTIPALVGLNADMSGKSLNDHSGFMLEVKPSKK